MNRRELGPDHPEVAGGGTSLAYWLVSEGEYDEAASLLEEAVAIRTKALGADHPQLASTLTVKATLLDARGQYTEALDVAGQSLQILEPRLPADHWLIAMAKNVQGAALTGLGRYAEAEKLLLASLPALAGSPISQLPQRGRARLQELYVAWGKPEKAARFAR